jgi:DNA-binding NarL/FixJ family response regulator
MMFDIADDDVRAPRDVAETLDELAALLSPEEQLLFSLMRQDLTDGEIAERLGIKTRTVREHQRAIIEKLRLYSNNQ